MFNLPAFLMDTFFNRRYKKRIARYVAGLCEDNSLILDLGCGDGSIAHMIKEINPTLKIVGIDIYCHRKAKISVTAFDGKTIPSPDNNYDIVMAIDVLHHTDDILGMLTEMRRVTGRHLIIKDCQTEGWFSKMVVSVGDFVSNSPFGVKCAYNYPTPKQWQGFFDDLELKHLLVPKKLRYGFFWINESHDPIFKLLKSSC
jgi:SAM-dependent methyltransferase